MKLNCKISENILNQYNIKYSWIPKKDDISLCHIIKNNVLTDYYSYQDYILINFFQEKRIIDENNKFFIKNKSIIPNKNIFIKNFNLLLETNHYIIWYYNINNEPSEKQVISDVKNKIVNLVGNENFEFVVLDDFSKEKHQIFSNIYCYHVFWTLK